MTLNVLIDAISITRDKAGVGVYANNLIRHLVTSHPGIRLHLLVQDDDPDFDYSGSDGVVVIRVPASICRSLPIRFLTEQILIPYLLLRYRIHVVHSLHYSFPLLNMGAKRVVTLHDMTSFLMPELHISSKAVYYRTFIRAAVRFADKLIFVSKSSQQDCDRLFRLRPNSSTVIHLGTVEISRHHDPVLSDGIRKRYTLPSTFILYVGTIEPRKNLTTLVKAFAPVATCHPECALVIAGKKGWLYDDLFETIARLGLQSRIIFTGFIPEEDKAYLMQAATVFAYPSLYEGFGIPVLEAMACGIPTVTSNLSSIPEFTGDATLLVDPTNSEELAAALETLLSDANLREKLARKSVSRAAYFTWDRTAAQTIDVYRSLT